MPFVFMYIVENIEKLTQIFNKIEILGICTHEKNFQTEFIIYLQTKKKKIQIQSFVPFPDEAKITYKEVKVIDMDKINWFKKGTSFLKAKFGKKKYDKSF